MQVVRYIGAPYHIWRSVSPTLSSTTHFHREAAHPRTRVRANLSKTSQPRLVFSVKASPPLAPSQPYQPPRGPACRLLAGETRPPPLILLEAPPNPNPPSHSDVAGREQRAGIPRNLSSRQRDGEPAVLTAYRQASWPSFAGWRWALRPRMLRWAEGPPSPWHRIRSSWQAASWVGRWRGWPGGRDRRAEGASVSLRMRERANERTRRCC